MHHICVFVCVCVCVISGAMMGIRNPVIYKAESVTVLKFIEPWDPDTNQIYTGLNMLVG